MEAERDDNWAADKVDQSSRAREDWQHVQRLREGDAESGHALVPWLPWRKSPKLLCPVGQTGQKPSFCRKPFDDSRRISSKWWCFITCRATIARKSARSSVSPSAR